MTGYRPYLLGLILASVTVVVAVLLPRQMEKDLLAMVLAVIGAVYLGFGLAEGDERAEKTEVVAAAAFILVALLGRWTSLTLLGIGYLAHAAWDAAHRTSVVHTRVPAWYPGLCAVYDVIVGLYVLSIASAG